MPIASLPTGVPRRSEEPCGARWSVRSVLVVVALVCGGACTVDESESCSTIFCCVYNDGVRRRRDRRGLYLHQLEHGDQRPRSIGSRGGRRRDFQHGKKVYYLANVSGALWVTNSNPVPRRERACAPAQRRRRLCIREWSRRAGGRSHLRQREARRVRRRAKRAIECAKGSRSERLPIVTNHGGFSWNRLLGITTAKRKVSRATGIPWTKSGRQRKVGAMFWKLFK